jgi:nucleoside-diphosphate-sugar epimerase
LTDERFLVTGGTGCIGSWVVRTLVRDSVPVVVLSSGENLGRLRLILTDQEFERVVLVRGDIADQPALEALVRDRGVNRIIHLAAWQFPFCAANPAQGALANVVGTVNVFEVARRLGLERVVYASSAAVFGPKSHYPEAVLSSDAPFWPTSHYGAYKLANEQNARVFWQNDGLSSIGLRPHSVYGPGRDQGVTSKPTVAMIAAAAGRPYHVNFGGRCQFQYAPDVAATYVAATRVEFTGAAVFSIGGRIAAVSEIVEAIEQLEPTARGQITHGDEPLAFPEAFDNRAMVDALGPYHETPLADGIAETLDCYRRALARGTIDEAWLDRVLA